MGGRKSTRIQRCSRRACRASHTGTFSPRAISRQCSTTKSACPRCRIFPVIDAASFFVPLPAISLYVWPFLDAFIIVLPVRRTCIVFCASRTETYSARAKSTQRPTPKSACIRYFVSLILPHFSFAEYFVSLMPFLSLILPQLSFLSLPFFLYLWSFILFTCSS